MFTETVSPSGRYLLVFCMGSSCVKIDPIVDSWIEGSYQYGELKEHPHNAFDYVVFPNASKEPDGEAFYISLDILGTRIASLCLVEGKFIEQVDTAITYSIFRRLLYLSMNVRSWLMTTVGFRCSDNTTFIFRESTDSELVCYVMFPELLGFPKLERFTWLVALIALDNVESKSMSWCELSKGFRSRKNVRSIVSGSRKRHLRILNKIAIGLLGHCTDANPELIFKYIFEGSRSDANRKHIVRLCHIKEINYAMIQCYTSLRDSFTFDELSKLKFMYDIEELSETGSVASSVRYLMDSGYTYEQLVSLSPKDVLKEEVEVHRVETGFFGGCHLFGRADGAIFDKPFKAGLPKIIEYIPSQEGLDGEGVEMQHCVASYGGECVSGRISIYKVFGEQRCTLAVNNESGQIIEMYGFGNATATSSSWLLVENWLFGSQKQAIAPAGVDV